MKSVLARVAVTIFAALGGLLSSCVQIEDSSKEVGYLSFSLVSVDYTIENLNPTKATVPADDLPSVEDFTVTIDGPAINAPLVYEPGTLPADKVELPVGTYDVTVSYGANDFGTPYFCSSKSVPVSPFEETSVSFAKVPMANAMLALRLPEDFSLHMTNLQLTLSDGTKIVDVQPEAYVYVPAGKNITAIFKGINSIGDTKEISIDLGKMDPQHAYDITCNLSLPSIVLPDQTAGAWSSRLYVTPAVVGSSISSGQIVYEVIESSSSDWTSPLASSEVIQGEYHVVKGLENGKTYKVRARVGNVLSNVVSFTVRSAVSGTSYSVGHTYASNGFLTGTSATADLKLTGIMETLKNAGLLDLSVHLKNGNEVYRTASAISGTMSDSNNWPYIPKGTGYSLLITHKCGGESSGVTETINDISLADPKVSVDVSAYTTYDRYLAYKSGKGELSDANNYDKRLLVEGRQVVLTIADNILQNTKYASLLSGSVTYAGSQLTSITASSSAVNTIVYDDVTYTDSQWGSYAFNATLTFDGVNATDSHTCHITGLPYTFDFYDNEGGLNSSLWTKSAITYTNKKCCIAYNNTYGYLITPQFKIPSSVEVSNSVQAQAYRASFSKYSAKLRVGTTSSTGSVAASYSEYTMSDNNSTGKKYETFNTDMSLTNSSSYISLHHNSPSKASLAAWSYICLYEFSVNYR